MTTFLVAHGAWSAGWAWKKMRPLMRAARHELWTPTYTGIGERAHLSRPDIDLDTHIADVLGVLEYEDLSDIVLIGHSYGGMVATGVADRARERVRRLIYLDAFAPRDGQSLLDLAPPEHRERIEASVDTDEGKGYLVVPNPLPPDTSKADLAWAMPKRVRQPIGTIRQKLHLTGGPLTLPIDYIYALRHPDTDVFGPFAERARAEGWGLHEIDASHNPHITCPEVLMSLLEDIIRGR
jgi:pimeloyl-ACP methyl ester carboxylesterase